MNRRTAARLRRKWPGTGLFASRLISDGMRGEAMSTALIRCFLVSSAVVLGLGVSSASAFVAGPRSPEAFGVAPSAMPVAMCGYTCRRGGRYIPGPPQVCYDRGLEY